MSPAKTDLERAEQLVRRAVRNSFGYPSVPSKHLAPVLAEYDRRGEELAGYDPDGLKWIHAELSRFRAQRDAALALADEWERATSLLMPPAAAELIRRTLGGGS